MTLIWKCWVEAFYSFSTFKRNLEGTINLALTRVLYLHIDSYNSPLSITTTSERRKRYAACRWSRWLLAMTESALEHEKEAEKQRRRLMWPATKDSMHTQNLHCIFEVFFPLLIFFFIEGRFRVWGFTAIFFYLKWKKSKKNLEESLTLHKNHQRILPIAKVYPLEPIRIGIYSCSLDWEQVTEIVLPPPFFPLPLFVLRLWCHVVLSTGDSGTPLEEKEKKYEKEKRQCNNYLANGR